MVKIKTLNTMKKKPIAELLWDEESQEVKMRSKPSPPPIQSIEEAAEKANGYSVYGKGGDKYNAFNEGFLAGAEHQARQQPVTTNAEIQKAIADIERFSQTHIDWANHFEANPEIEKEYVATGKWDTAKEHRQIVADYENVLNILKSCVGQQPVRKTLDECKDEVAIEKGYPSFETMENFIVDNNYVQNAVTLIKSALEESFNKYLEYEKSRRNS